MSWIKDNKFLVALGGGTLVGAILLYFAGSKLGAEKYEAAKTDFDTSAGEASSYESTPLYPRPENVDGKTKALGDYRKATESLQATFEPFRPKEIKNISPQDFTNQLKTVNDEVRKAFDDAGTNVPEAFFCGFEKYKTIVAPGSATGILNYQLEAIKHLMLGLAASSPTELKNIHRPSLPEEDSQAYKPGDPDVARALPLEITFQGSEKSVRDFVSKVVKPDDHFYVIRTLRVTNAKKDPPRTADAKFEKPAAAKTGGGGAADVFGGGFVLPGDEAKPAEAAPAPKPAAASSDSSRILAQVLGTEEVQVFIRLDVMQFLPAKKLP